MRSKNESKNINRDYSLINILAHLAQRWLNINAFRILISFDSLKRLLNMNMIKFLSIPGLISALALIIIMLPQDAGEWVQVIQLKGLIAMSFIVLSYTVLSKTDLVLWMLHFV